MEFPDPTPPALPKPSKWEHRAIAAVLVLVAVVPFVRALGFGFVYDDIWIVQHNPAIVGWQSLLTLWQHPYWMDAEGVQAGLYRPMQTAILAIVRNATGGWPIWFHLYALSLHATVTLLVWRLLDRGVRRWPAVLGALWFAAHPVHVEAIANISNSAEPLVALCTLGLYFVLARMAGRHVRWRDALLAAVLFLGAMLSKESGALALAMALFAVEAWSQPNESAQARVANNSPFQSLAIVWRQWRRVVIAGLGAAAIVGVVRLLVLGSPLHGGASMAAVGIEHMSTSQRAWTMLSLGPMVLRLLVWPSVHNPYYGPSYFPAGSHAVLAVLATVGVLTLAVAGAIWLGRRPANTSPRDAGPLAAITWTLLAFLPASNLFVATGQILAERTLYVPSIGMAMLLAWGLDRLTTVVQRRVRWNSRTRTAPLATAICAAVIVPVCLRFAALSQSGTAAWRSHRALSEQMIAADPRGYRGHYMLALELRRGPSSDSVRHEFATAYALYPKDPQLNADYDRFLLAHKRPGDVGQIVEPR
jgi:hypothetical protein